ncbi:hypothetical protein EHS13_13605 [Paenibacillus psychroresistens]|uniref:Uncharacterized protein n=1 Tax=Paenibacillus psychroresistens TaxID=1778678 RepID=A0A6B8RID9_9BACL|nr:hypothetical protein [Paenibacillus psychroresistens]QGQ95839.1 hypothetical protein EHS13_13605 [Paenibacillus psychroresistens]
MSEKRLLQSMIGDRIWRLRDTNQAEFINEVRRYFALGLPGYKVVRAKYPIIYLKKENSDLI